MLYGTWSLATCATLLSAYSEGALTFARQLKLEIFFYSRCKRIERLPDEDA